jgi:hypothetical protein
MKKMSASQQKQLLDYAEKSVNTAMDKLYKISEYQSILESAYKKIGKRWVDNYKAEFDTEFNMMVSGRKTLKDLL